MPMRLKVDTVDNRGSADVPFGYVYFSDGSRVGYAPGAEHELFAGNWAEVTVQHLRLAHQYLAEHGVKFKQPQP